MIVREAVVSLYGAWRLAHLDRRGFELFDKTPAGAMRSFYAAVLVAPIYALVLAMAPVERAGAGGPRWLLVEAIAYVISWLAYPLVVEQLTRSMGCRALFEGYLSAYNWSMVLQNAALLPLVLLTATNVVPEEILQLLWLAAIVAIMAWLWFIARTALDVGAFTAAGLVLLDELLSFMIDSIAGGLSQ
jgi:hypothetical protein